MNQFSNNQEVYPNSFKAVFCALLAFATFMPQALHADGLVFGIEGITGSNRYELEPMLAQDVAITDDYTKPSISATNKWNTPWQETPLKSGLVSLFYELDAGQFKFLIGGRHTHLDTSFNYTGYKYKSGSNASVLPVHIKITERINDGEVAMKIPLDMLGLPSVSFIPILGHRSEFFRGRYRGIGAGRSFSNNHNFAKIKLANLDDSIAGQYGGAKIELALTPKFHLFAGALSFGLRGSEKELEFEEETLDTGALEDLGLEVIETKVRSIGATYTAGIKYKITKTLHLHLGYVYERFNVSFPDYTNLVRYHYTDSSGGSLEIPSHADLITDRFIYGRQELREKRHIFLGLEYDLHL